MRLRRLPMLALLATLPVIAAGLWRSQMLAQPLWSPLLAWQGIAVLLVAALAAPAAIWAFPLRWRGWPAIAAVLALAAAAAFGPAAAAAAAIGAATCLLLGLAVFTFAGPPGRPGEPIEPALAAATGLGIVMLLLVGAAVARLPTAATCFLLPLAALATLTSPAQRAALRTTIPRTPATIPSPFTAIPILAALLFTLLNAALPERFWDPLTYHLMVPTQSLLFGHWMPDPARFAFAYIPLGADHVFTFATALGGDPFAESAAKLVNPLALACLLGLLHTTIRETIGPRLAEFTLLLFVTLPLTLLLSSTAVAEVLLALQVLAATRAVLMLSRHHAPALLAAFCVLLGSLAAIKLHGVLVGLPLALLALPAIARHPRVLLAPRFLLIAAPALMLGAAQYADAWVRTGNPLFPVLNDVFRSPLWPATRFEDLRWQNHLDWRLLYRMTFDSRSYLESDNGVLGITFILLLLPGLAATFLQPRRTPLTCLFVAALYIAGLIPSIQYIRYLFPVLPLLLVVCAQGLAALPPRWPAAVTACAAAFGIALAPSAGWVLKTADLRAAFDPARAHAMLAAQVPTRLAVQAVNAIGGPKPRVLFGGEPYAAFLRGTYILAAWYNHALYAALYAAPGPDAVDAALTPTHSDFAIANPASSDPIEQKVATWAAAHGTRLPLAGPIALWKINPP